MLYSLTDPIGCDRLGTASYWHRGLRSLTIQGGGGGGGRCTNSKIGPTCDCPILRHL